jgi:DNA invertase Pin-like site-specific DNA recombinase
VANLVYKRVSTEQQSTARQDLVLADAGIEDPIVFEEDRLKRIQYRPDLIDGCSSAPA